MKSLLNPYKGLNPYEERDEDNFFGRDADRDILIDKILSNNLTLLFAASGVGKSSLLEAAVLPRLKHPEHHNLDAVSYNSWTPEPVKGLKDKIFQSLKDRGRFDPKAQLDDIQEESLNQFFQYCTIFTRQPLVIILDQFEEFFQYHRRKSGFRPFIRELTDCILDPETPVSIVISMREDFALELNAFKPQLSGMVFENFYRLEKLTRENAKLAITEPLKTTDFKYEPELLTRLLDDLTEPDKDIRNKGPVADTVDTVEPPHLQIICSRLWELEKESKTKRIRLITYTEKGGDKGFLKTYVQSCIGDFSEEKKVICSRAFDHLISRYGTKISFTIKALADVIRKEERALAEVLEDLENARILRRRKGKPADLYELYHDLFSESIETWNTKFKKEQEEKRRRQKEIQRRNRNIIITICILAVILTFYTGLDWYTNYSSNYLKYTPTNKPENDTIELYHGSNNPFFIDIFRQKKFLAETIYPGRYNEWYQLHRIKPVMDFPLLETEMIRELSQPNRIYPYWRDGQIEMMLRAAKQTIEKNDSLSTLFINILINLHSEKSFSLLGKILTESRSEELSQAIVLALKLCDTPLATDLLSNEFKRKASLVWTAVGIELIIRGEKLVMHDLLDLIFSQSHISLSFSPSMYTGNLLHSNHIDSQNKWYKTETVAKKIAGQEYIGLTNAILKRLMSHPGNKLVYEILSDSDLSQSSETLEEFFINPHTPIENKNEVNKIALLGQKSSIEFKINNILNNFLSNSNTYNGRATFSKLMQIENPSAKYRFIEFFKTANPDIVSNILKSITHTSDEKIAGQFLNDPEIGKILLEIIKTGQPEERALAATAMDVLKIYDIEIINLLQKEADRQTLFNIIKLIPNLNNPDAVPHLISLLFSNPDFEKTKIIIDTLVELKSEKSVRPLVRLMSSSDKRIRNASAEGLLELRFPETVPLLLQHLANDDPAIKISAINALANLQDERAIVPLINIMGNKELLHDIVKIRAIHALSVIDSSKAIPHLIDLVTQYKDRVKVKDNSIFINSISALGNLGSIDALPIIENLLKHKDKDIVTASIEALKQIGSLSSIPPLYKIFKHGGPWVKFDAAEALLELGHVETARDLVAMIQREQVGNNTQMKLLKILCAYSGIADGTLLPPLLKHPDKEVRFKSLESLSWQSSAETNAAIGVFITDNKLYRRKFALNQFEKKGTAHYLQKLQVCAVDHDRFIRQKARYNLAQLGYGHAIKPHLTLRQTDSSAYTTLSLSYPLGHFIDGWKNPLELPHNEILGKKGHFSILEKIRSNNEGIGSYNVTLLGMLDDLDTTTHLQRLAESEQRHIKEAAVAAMALRENPPNYFPLFNLQVPFSRYDPQSSQWKNRAWEELLNMDLDPVGLKNLVSTFDKQPTEWIEKNLSRINKLKSHPDVHNWLVKLFKRHSLPEGLNFYLAVWLSDDQPELRKWIYSKISSPEITQYDMFYVLENANGLLTDYPDLKQWLWAKLQTAPMADKLRSADILVSSGDLEAKSWLKSRLMDESRSDGAKAALLGYLSPNAIEASWMTDLVRSPIVNVRSTVAKKMAGFEKKEAVPYLIQLLNDDNYLVRTTAMETLQTLKALDLKNVLPLLNDPSMDIQVKATKYLKEMADPSSIPMLEKVLFNDATPISIQFLHIEVLQSIGTPEAAAVIQKAVSKEGYQKVLWLKGYHSLREMNAAQTLEALKKDLSELTADFHMWREKRDKAVRIANDNISSNSSNPEKPSPHLVHELAFTITRLGGVDLGFSLLDHELAYVRAGAAFALGSMGTADMIKALWASRLKQNDPIFRNAAYRAIDWALIHIELTGGETELNELIAFEKKLFQAKGLQSPQTIDIDEGVRTRVNWTISELKRKSSSP